jgi:hypothetical protein
VPFDSIRVAPRADVVDRGREPTPGVGGGIGESDGDVDGPSGHVVSPRECRETVWPDRRRVACVVRFYSARIRLRLHRLAENVETRAQRAVREGATVVRRSWLVRELGTPGGMNLMVYTASCQIDAGSDPVETERRLRQHLRAEFGGDLLGDTAVSVTLAPA